MEEIVAKLRQVDVLMAQGRPAADVARAIGATEVTYRNKLQNEDLLRPQGGQPNIRFAPKAVIPELECSLSPDDDAKYLNNNAYFILEAAAPQNKPCTLIVGRF